MASSFFAGLLSDNDEGSSSYHDQSSQPSFLDRARTAAGLQPTRREEMIDSYCPQLTWKQRVYGFFICFGVGCLISLGSVMFFNELLAGHPAKFAISDTLGNILELGSTLFLMGFARQLKRMSHPTRWATALVFVLAMVATLFSALFLQKLTKWPQSVVAIVRAGTQPTACVVERPLTLPHHGPEPFRASPNWAL